jgi:RNA polymerase-binding transcription factor DksA
VTPPSESLGEQLASARAQIDALSRDLAGLLAASGSVATDDEHDPEGVTIAVERAQLTGLIEAAQRRVGEAEAALARVADGTYGVCEGCGGPIGAGRLDARPAASTCINCA